MPEWTPPPTKILWLKAASLGMALLASACAHGPVCNGVPPSAFLGIGPDNEQASAQSVDARADVLLAQRPVSDLTCWAKHGDRGAQYSLGRAYELGEAGLMANRGKAIRYYRQAARIIPNQTYVYSPPVGKESYGRVIPVTIGSPSPGLPEAIEALKRLKGER